MSFMLIVTALTEICKKIMTKPVGRHYCDHFHLPPVQRCDVQATVKSMGMTIWQERARWPNLTSLKNLSHREREDMLDMVFAPEGIFGSNLASMQ